MCYSYWSIYITHEDPNWFTRYKDNYSYTEKDSDVCIEEHNVSVLFMMNKAMEKVRSGKSAFQVTSYLEMLVLSLEHIGEISI